MHILYYGTLVTLVTPATLALLYRALKVSIYFLNESLKITEKSTLLLTVTRTHLDVYSSPEIAREIDLT